MMDFKSLNSAQRLVLVGNIAMLLGGMMISLGTLLSMQEPPVEPLSFGSNKRPDLLGGNNGQGQSYFF